MAKPDINWPRNLPRLHRVRETSSPPPPLHHPRLHCIFLAFLSCTALKSITSFQSSFLIWCLLPHCHPLFHCPPHLPLYVKEEIWLDWVGMRWVARSGCVQFIKSEFLVGRARNHGYFKRSAISLSMSILVGYF